ncbi:hypothetical protein ACI8AC_17925 [Geodermatophilus sp. SYSU D00758]
MSPEPGTGPTHPGWTPPVPAQGPAGGLAPYGYLPQPAPPPTTVVPVKTPGIAVLLSVLWMGAGHLYAGKTGAGVAFMITGLFLWLLWLVPLIGWVLAPLLWLPIFIVAAYTAAAAAREHNAHWGITRL